MKTIIAIALMVATFAHPAPPALTGKRRAEIAGAKMVQKVERKKTGKKGSTNEWETVRSFPLMFGPAKAALNKPKKETRP